ncbi:MAG: hypothetical protein H7336_12750 [Bacteriovorax sp.]|nr:hypothetical protein [Bacteriovorax sp.]
MDHARNKFKFTFLILFLLASCSRTPEQQLVSIIENKYANLYVNDKRHKREILANLNHYLKDHKLNDKNIKDITTKVHQINDGHVVLFDDRKEKNIIYASGINFIPGSLFIKSCAECSPALVEDKYEILEVNNLNLKDYLEAEKFSVAASTPWGRNYRVSHALRERSDNNEVTVKVKSSSGKLFSSKLIWHKQITIPPVCVSGERLQDNVFKLNIENLWCDDTTAKTPWGRDQIFANFKNQFDDSTSTIKPTDKIIIDLRDNGGGGDTEVEYVLNAFNEKSVFMYHYKYLKKTQPGKAKWLAKFWPVKLDLWAKDGFDFTNLKNKPAKTFFDNKVLTLISAGCFSSCETIASVLKLEKRSVLLGSRTHGGSGDPVIFPIKGTHYSINIPTCITWQENGRFYEGSGVHPDQEVLQRPLLKADNVLKTAIDQVQ